MFKIINLILSIVLLFASSAFADGHKLKVGMITTLSGGGSGLGIDVRDGFMLAVKGNKNISVITKDDQRKPDIAVQLADKMIQSDKVDVLTGIIWSNLAMAVVPATVNQGKFYLSPNAGPSKLAGKGCHKNYFNVAWQNDNLHEAAGGYANSAGFKNTFILAPNYPAGKDALTGFKRYFKGNLAGEIYTKLGQTDYAVEIAQIRASDASQGYDTGMLLISAMAKASVNDMEAFRDALRSADFDSTRGQFRFSSNHHPIQDIYVREVIKEGDTLTNKIVSVGLQDHSNAYVDQCSM